MIKTIVAAAILAVSFSAPSHAFFLPGGMFSGSFDYVVQSKNNTTRTASVSSTSMHAVKARLFSIGDPDRAEGGDA